MIDSPFSWVCYGDSQRQHYGHLGEDNSLLGGGVPGRTIGRLPEPYLLDTTSNVSSYDNQKMSPDMAKHHLGGKITPG